MAGALHVVNSTVLAWLVVLIVWRPPDERWGQVVLTACMAVLILLNTFTLWTLWKIRRLS